jgi:hypothetical protein
MLREINDKKKNNFKSLKRKEIKIKITRIKIDINTN